MPLETQTTRRQTEDRQGGGEVAFDWLRSGAGPRAIGASGAGKVTRQRRHFARSNSVQTSPLAR
jgi:hypothetical protein